MTETDDKIPSLTREQYNFVVEATEAAKERRKARSAIWERTEVALIWAVIAGAATVLLEWVKFKISGMSK